MPVTVDLSDLRAVMRLGAASPPDAVLTPAAESAALLANEELASCGYSAERLEKIALYLAAHFAAPSVGAGAAGAVASESTGRSSISYSTASLGQDLRGTSYGQVALQLDTKGCLQRLGKRRASLTTFPREDCP